MYHSLVSPNVQ